MSDEKTKEEAAERLADLAMELLSKLSPKERARRIAAFAEAARTLPTKPPTE